MEAKSIDRYWVFGTQVRYIQDATSGWPVHGDEYVVRNIDSFRKYLREFGLLVTERAAAKLWAIHRRLAAKPEGHRLTAEEALELRETMTDIRNTLTVETAGHVAYVLTEKRFDVKRLLRDVAGLMPAGVFAALPELAQFDFGEAGKCIAFQLPTASAFHALRGTEGVLRHLYTETVKRDRASLMWGPMVTHLRKRRVSPPEAVLDDLNSIRVHFRNPTQHPELRYTLDEAQTLFGRAVGVVGQMTEWIGSR